MSHSARTRIDRVDLITNRHKTHYVGMMPSESGVMYGVVYSCFINSNFFSARSQRNRNDMIWDMHYDKNEREEEIRVRKEYNSNVCYSS